MTHNKLYFWTVFGSIVLAALPFFALWVLYGSYHIPPEFMDDSGYYYARMEAVAHGFPFIGNPYFKEHAIEIAASFFGADWVAAAPLLVGIPLLPAIIGNAMLWTGVLCALCILLFRTLELTRRQAAVSAIVVILSVFWYMERPVAMQIVYPSFALLLLAYAAWLAAPANRMRCILFAGAAALTFYIYTYEWQITALIFFFTHILLVRDWRRYRSLLAIDATVLLLIIPMLWYTVRQLQNPWYWETVRRIGFIETHTFGSTAALVLAQLVLGIICLYLARKRLADPKIVFFAITGISIGAASVSNVITGKDLETAVHVSRFMVFWASYAACAILCVVLPLRSAPHRLRLAALGAAILLISLLIPSLRMSSRVNAGARAAEAYAPTLTWLRLHTEPESVIFAPDELAYYIPIETNDYVLFQPDGGLYLMPDQEVTERYLASRIATTTNLARIEMEYRAYAGVGNAVHAYKTHNRAVQACRLLHQSDCGILAPSAQSYKGEAYFKSLLAQYAAMQNDPITELRKFNVGYVVVPAAQILPENLRNTLKPAATVGNYAIYRLPPA